MGTLRAERVASEIRAAVADLFLRQVLHDPRIGDITITDVEVSPDLRTARVYYSMLGAEEEKAETQKGLDAARSFVRREVTKVVKLRVSPAISFKFDPTLEEGARIDRLLREVRNKEGW